MNNGCEPVENQERHPLAVWNTAKMQRMLKERAENPNPIPSEDDLREAAATSPVPCCQCLGFYEGVFFAFSIAIGIAGVTRSAMLQGIFRSVQLVALYRWHDLQHVLQREMNEQADSPIDFDLVERAINKEKE